jgi:hypothetical protein
VPGPPYVCVVLAENHELGHFECGDDRYDEWLINRARAAQEHFDSTVYVLVEPERPDYVLAYFTLSSSNVSRTGVSGRFRKHTSFESLPATLIGMLARHRSERGMLDHILRAAFERALEGSRVVASRLLVIDAGSENLATLYEGYGFKRAKQVDGATTIRLVLLMQDLVEALQEDAEDAATVGN